MCRALYPAQIIVGLKRPAPECVVFLRFQHQCPPFPQHVPIQPADKTGGANLAVGPVVVLVQQKLKQQVRQRAVFPELRKIKLDLLPESLTARLNQVFLQLVPVPFSAAKRRFPT